jgi:phosphohistidine phosphatase
VHLLLAQHGHALPKEADPDRPLSEQGRADVEAVAGRLARAGVHAGRVLHSGKTRARQTAEILAGAVATGVPVEARAGLDPNDDPKPVEKECAGWQEDVLLVGHMPFVARLAARLCGARKGREPVAFVPGSVVGLERGEDGRWAVAWMLRPELAR